MGRSISTSGAGSRRRRTASGGQCDLHHAPGHRPSSASSPFLAATALCLSGLFACARGEKNKVRQQWGTSSSGGPGSEVGLPSPATVSVRRRCEGTAMDAVGPFTLAMENRVRSEYRSSSAMEDVKHASEAAAANTNRRALRDIKNIIGAPHRHHHLAVTKRGLHEKPSAADAKNQPGGFAGHRPVTRKFAAALATQPANGPLHADPNA